MTTAAYDGRYLAADSRVTYPDRSHTCPSCNHTGAARKDDSVKLAVLPRNKKFRGEEIIAVAKAGSVQISSDLLKILRSGEDLEVAYKHFRMFSAGLRNSGHLLVVTEKSVFEVSALDNKEELVVVQHPRTAKVAIGSGGVAAKLAMSVIGFSAMDAVAEVMKHDEYTGGDIKHIDTNDPKILVYEVPKEQYRVVLEKKKRPGRKPGTKVAPKAVPKKPAVKKATAKKAAVKKVTKKPVAKKTAKAASAEPKTNSLGTN